MALHPALQSAVSSTIRERGAAYFRSGAVTSIDVSGGVISASVRGTDRYDVWLEQDGDLLRTGCTCPYFIDQLLVCKHVWAVILAADQRGWLPSRADAPLADIEPVDIDADDELPLPRPAPHKTAKATPPRSTPALWRGQLGLVAASAVRAAETASPAMPAALLYVVDVPASRAADAIVVSVMGRDLKANGTWRKPRPARLMASQIRLLPDSADRDILYRLLGGRPYYDWNPIYPDPGQIGQFRLDATLARDLLPAMCATGRCVAQTHQPGAVDHLPLAWDSGPAWTLAITITRDDSVSYLIQGLLRRDGEEMPLGAPLVSSAGLIVTPTTVATVDDGGASGWLTALRTHGTIAVPVDARPELINMLLTQPPPLTDVPDELRLVIVDGTPTPALRLTPVKHYASERLVAELLVDYDGLRIPATLPHPLISTPESTTYVRRNITAERGFLQTLHEVGVRREWNPAAMDQLLMIGHDRLSKTVRALLDRGWSVDASGVVYRRHGTVSMHVSSGIDWFELRATVDYDGAHASLPALLAAAKRGDGFVTLDDGSVGLLPDEWLRKNELLTRLGTAEGDSIRFRPSQAALLDALLAAQPDVTCDALFTRTRRELETFAGIASVDAPATFIGTLRPYQREGLGWLHFLRRFGFGGCLADDMGLGKTVMVLALLAGVRAERRRGSPRRPSLVVAPRSLVFNWQREAERFTPHLRVLDYSGSGRAEQRDALTSYDIVLTTYGTLRRDAAHLADVNFGYVVLDEAQSIKNASSASAKAARLLKAEHRLALSGTPIENHLGELWSLFEFLNPGLLGGSSAFERAGGRSLDEDAVATLARGLRPFILRRTKAQVAKDLPEKTEQTIYCELERPQRALYDQLRDHYRRALLGRIETTGLGRSKLQVLEALLRLRQAACHPGLIDAARKKDPSAKLDVLVPRIVEAVEEGHKTLVFSQFTSLLAILRDRLDAAGVAYEYLDGKTKDRQSTVDRFQTDPTCRLFLISLKAGGLGLNLTEAEYVFLLDPWWNPAVEAQAIDRAHRIGQTRQVFAYRLIAKDTVEERVLELQQSKRKLADAILSADESLIRTLKKEDLELLLS